MVLRAWAVDCAFALVAEKPGAATIPTSMARRSEPANQPLPTRGTIGPNGPTFQGIGRGWGGFKGSPQGFPAETRRVVDGIGTCVLRQAQDEGLLCASKNSPYPELVEGRTAL